MLGLEDFNERPKKYFLISESDIHYFDKEYLKEYAIKTKKGYFIPAEKVIEVIDESNFLAEVEDIVCDALESIDIPVAIRERNYNTKEAMWVAENVTVIPVIWWIEY